MSKAKKPTWAIAKGLTFEHLVGSIRGVDAELAAQAGRAVNISLTLRKRADHQTFLLPYRRAAGP
jgi:hypothetical protein